MILAGIDEAGYGPLLGPLVVGSCAFELSGDADGELPCVWKILRKTVSKKRSKTGQKLHINDSKLVYSPGTGLKELERSVLALLTASGEMPGDFNQMLHRVAAHALPQLGAHRWYQPTDDERFPIEQEAMTIQLFANGLRREMQRTATNCVYLQARLLTERELNRQFDATRNKSSVLFSASAVHLDNLIRAFGQQQLVIFCDRQGGREHYAALLRLMFDDWALEILREADGYAEYRLSRGGHFVRIIFCEKAESQCLPVAMASMLSKYLREAMMRRFNAWWQLHLPGVAPTAGYYNDGERFLRDVQAKRTELGIQDGELIRSR